jgi:hypothetical protein
MAKKFSIPEITDERIQKYAGVSALRRNGNKLFVAGKHDVRGTSWPWLEGMEDYKGKLKEKCRIRTLHSYGYYGFFKPSVAEVLAQATDEQLSDVVAFETLGPETTSDLNEHREELNEGFHVAETILYVEG